MAVITLGGVDYPAPATPVQADSQATSLEPNMVPTGGTIASVLDDRLTWKNLLASGTSFVPTTAESTINLCKGLDEIHEILVVVRSLAYNYNAIRQSLVIPRPYEELSANVLPDFMFSSTRMYFCMRKNTNTSIKISDASPTSGTCNWGAQIVSLYYR